MRIFHVTSLFVRLKYTVLLRPSILVVSRKNANIKKDEIFNENTITDWKFQHSDRMLQCLIFNQKINLRLL